MIISGKYKQESSSIAVVQSAECTNYKMIKILKIWYDKNKSNNLLLTIILFSRQCRWYKYSRK